MTTGVTYKRNSPFDGQPRRVLDTSRAEKEFGFIAKTDLEEGPRKTIGWYCVSRGLIRDKGKFFTRSNKCNKSSCIGRYC